MNPKHPKKLTELTMVKKTTSPPRNTSPIDPIMRPEASNWPNWARPFEAPLRQHIRVPGTTVLQGWSAHSSHSSFEE